MATELTFSPADPTPITDGVLFTVTGPVARGRIVIRDGDDAIQQASTEFGQKDRLGGDPNAQAWTAEVTGSPTGGNFKLGVKNVLDSGAIETTANIAHDANAAAIESALEALDNVGAGNVAVSGTGPFTIVFSGDLPTKGVSLTLEDNDLTGGSSPSVSLAQTTLGALDALEETSGGPFQWGPIYLPDGASSVADVVATADDDENAIYEGDSLISAPVVVYDYGDL